MKQETVTATLAGTDWLVWAFMLTMFLVTVVVVALGILVYQLRNDVKALQTRSCLAHSREKR